MGADTVKLTQHTAVAENSIAFLFDESAGFEFAAGQPGGVALINSPETDADGNTRAFSRADSPLKHGLTFGARAQDTTFRCVFKTPHLGTEMNVECPLGSRTLDEKTSRASVLARSVTPGYA